jgi:hypothetical protein
MFSDTSESEDIGLSLAEQYFSSRLTKIFPTISGVVSRKRSIKSTASIATLLELDILLTLLSELPLICRASPNQNRLSRRTESNYIIKQRIRIKTQQIKDVQNALIFRKARVSFQKLEIRFSLNEVMLGRELVEEVYERHNCI